MQDFENGSPVGGGGLEPRPIQRKHAYPDGPRAPRPLFKWLAGALKLYLVLEFLVILMSLFLLWIYLPSTVVPFTYEQLVLIDMVFLPIGIGRMIVYFFCVIMVCRVSYRLMRNLHTSGLQTPEMSPGWTAGWYFVPFANLWKPAEGMSQIYHGTFKAVGEASEHNSPIPAWWIFWLITNFSANISVRLAGGINGDNYSSTTFGLDVVSATTGIIAAYLLLRLLRRVVDRQERILEGGMYTVFD